MNKPAIPENFNLDNNDIAVMRVALVTQMQVFESYISRANDPEYGRQLPVSEVELAEGMLKNTIKLLEKFTDLSTIVDLMRDVKQVMPLFIVDVKINPEYL